MSIAHNLGREELESHTSIPVFCEVCESKEHVKQKCPVMKAPKIVVQWVGYAADGEGFYQIPHAPIKSTTDLKTAKITVEGVHLSAAQLIIELQHHIPSSNNWI